MVLALWMLHIVAPSGSVLENNAGDHGKGFGYLERGRLHQNCGLLWSSLAGAGLRPTKWSISVLRSLKETHTYTQGGLTYALKMWLVKCWTQRTTERSPEGLSLGLIVDHLQPSTSVDTMESQTVLVRSVYPGGRSCGGCCLRVGQLMILA